MNGIIFTACAFFAYVVIVSCTPCKHNDLTLCMEELSCTGTKIVGCMHEVCTCVDDPGNVAPPQSCLSSADCTSLNCDLGEEIHCLDNYCMCRKAHH